MTTNPEHAATLAYQAALRAAAEGEQATLARDLDDGERARYCRP